MADLNPAQLLKGEMLRLIDEWQLAPEAHTGTRRITHLLVRPMSLFESGDSDGSVSLGALSSKEHDISGASEHSLDDITYMICNGGWPKEIGKSKKIASTRMIQPTKGC